MNPFLFRKDNLDEVVFEHRNKQYGAYVLRKSYDGNLLKASASSFGILCVCVGLISVLSLFRKRIEPITDIVHITPVESVIRKVEYMLDPPEKVTRALKNVNATVFKIVKDRSVITRPVADPKPDFPENPLGSETGVEGGASNNLAGGTATMGGEETVTETKEDPDVVMFVSEMPSYPGGVEAMTDFISSHMNYPALARENGIEGKVVLSFVVLPDGSLAHIRIEKGIGFGCDNEALRVMGLMPRWIAGKQNGKLRAVKLLLPIHFKLQ